MFMLHSIAVGGPLNGVRLSGDSAWDGVIRTAKSTATSPVYYPGYYYWHEAYSAWYWWTTPKSQRYPRAQSQAS